VFPAALLAPWGSSVSRYDDFPEDLDLFALLGLQQPGDVARWLLADDPSLSNAQVSLMSGGLTRDQVKRIRYQMVCTGTIPPSRDTVPQPVRFREIPPAPPELMQGSCVGHPDADAWTSGDPARREFARSVCSGCHVQALCLTWSLSLPTSTAGIFGGTSRDDRKRLRAARAGKPVPLWLTADGKNAAQQRRRAARREAQAAHQQDQAEGGAA
jgi:hypothetical protein